MASNALKRTTTVIIAVFAVVTLIGVFIPSKPIMPSTQLDASWQYAMNEAVARHLSFGKDIVFTYGPYSFVSTLSYDPATDHLMVLGSLLPGVCYTLLLLYLASEANPYLVLAFLFYVAGFLSARDGLLFSYPLLLIACAIRHLEKGPAAEKKRGGPGEIALAALLVAPLGLLCLVKGTYLMLSGITAVCIFSLLLYHRRIGLAMIALICPVVATIALWKISGQEAAMLPGYFISILPIISGYTEALGSSLGDPMEMAAYLAAGVAIVISIARTRALGAPARGFLGGFIMIFLFLVFKSSFVRHDSHATIAGSTLLMAAMLVAMLSFDASMMIALFLSVITWLFIDEIHSVTSGDAVLDRLRSVYFETWTHLPSSGARRHYVEVEFGRSLASIRRKAAVPELQGSVDIYPTDQSAILASKNQWNPRPVFQSYSAYTPILTGMNERHLRGGAAPDNVLFSVDPIDEHLPSMEDGLSWPALLDNYTLAGIERNMAYLRKEAVIRSASSYAVIDEGMHRTGETVSIAETNVPVFAEIDLRPTLLGKLVGAAFKYPQLRMTVRLEDGISRNYRVLSNMMQPGFILSPLVENTQDFTLLLTRDGDFFRRNEVRSIMIAPEYGGGTLWEGSYALRLKAYQGGR